MGVDRASALGGAIVGRLGPLIKRHRVVHQNLRLAFPEMDPAERERIAIAQWKNFGRYVAETFLLDRLTPASGRIEIVGGDRLQAIAEAGTPAVFISGHLSNMETMAAVILTMGVDCVIAGRSLNNPYIDARLREWRRSYGVKTFATKSASGAREQLAALQQGKSVAHLVDQKNNKGMLAPFFGHPAPTETSAAKMALNANAPLVPISVQRLNGARFRVVVHEPLRVPSTGRRQDDAEACVREINAFVEARVREKPEEWWWMHRRWPKDLYQTLAAEPS